MLLKRGIHANRDPSTIYTTLKDAEEFFRDLTEESPINPTTSMRLAAVAAAHRIFCNSIAVLPWQVRQRVGDERLEPDHEIARILKTRYNSQMGQFTAERAIVSQAFWHGTGFGAIRRDLAGRVREIFPLPSAGYTRQVNPDDGAVWYFFSVDPDTPGGERLTRAFSESELLIFRFESFNGYQGLGMLDMARESMGTDAAAQKYNRKFFTNGSRLSGVVKVATSLDEDVKEVVRDDFERMNRGLDNAFRVAVLDRGMEYTPLGISQKDSQLLEARAFSVDEISRFTGIPAYMLQAGKQSYQSNEQQQLDFVTNTLTPPVTQIEQEWTWKLLSDEDRAAGMYLHKNLNALLRGDSSSRAAFYEKMISMSVFNPDEVRALEDMSPLPDGMGKTYRFSKNYAPVGEEGDES